MGAGSNYDRMEEGEAADPAASERIRRIGYYEEIFDEAVRLLRSGVPLSGAPDFQEKIQELADYYDSPEWLEDFEADEAGLLPADLKRGVLSEDGVYNLLDEFEL